MKSLYRRYRPIRLQDVAGQSQVTEPLLNALKQDRINHAYLFVGPRGCGKTSVARILAHEVNGFQYELEDSYVDIIEIDGASNRGIDNIRDLRDKAMIAPTKGKYKIYIIDEVHMLTKEAFNALLKILEEPPAHVIFIMATTDAHKVPVTITSRAQSYTFKLADQATMLGYLKEIVKKEKIKIDDDALAVIARKGGGSFRDTLSLLDQITTLSREGITKRMVIDAIGLPEDEKIALLLGAYVESNRDKITDTLNSLFAGGVKAEVITSELIASILDEPKPEYLDLLSRLPDVKAPYAEARLLVALLPPNARKNSAVTMPSVRAVSGNINSNTSSVNAPKKQSKVSNPDFDLGSNLASTPTSAPSPDFDSNPGPAAQEKPLPSNTDFNWEEYLEKVRILSDAVYTQLKKTKPVYSNNTLTIYPMKKIVKNILSRENNMKILVDALGGNVKITILDADISPETDSGDQTLSQISDIMGGEVINDAGDNPF